MFQCPPSRAGSCGSRTAAGLKLRPEFQCPPSRAGSCGALTLLAAASASLTFQCPPSRAGSCGAGAHRRAVRRCAEFQCPPSRAGSCGQPSRHSGRAGYLFQCPPSRAGSCGAGARPLGLHPSHQFQCPPSRAGSCGTNPTPGDRVVAISEVSVPSIAGRVLRERCDRARPCLATAAWRSFSALHRGQGPAGATAEAPAAQRTPPFQCPPSRAGSCGYSGSVTRSPGRWPFQCPPSRAGSCGSARRRRPSGGGCRRFSALHRGQGPAGYKLG